MSLDDYLNNETWKLDDLKALDTTDYPEEVALIIQRFIDRQPTIDDIISIRAHGYKMDTEYEIINMAGVLRYNLRKIGDTISFELTESFPTANGFHQWRDGGFAESSAKSIEVANIFDDIYAVDVFGGMFIAEGTKRRITAIIKYINGDTTADIKQLRALKCDAEDNNYRTFCILQTELNAWY